MFYEPNVDNALRFGDVLTGYILSNPDYKEPNFFRKDEDQKYRINIEIPKYSVVLTPCCSIKEGLISLTPLKEVLKTFFNNKYLAEDLTNINRRMTALESMTAENWEKLKEEERQERLEEGMQYAFPRYFIYEENDFFTEYKRSKKMIRYYMIDLKNICSIKCPMIKSAEKLKLEDAPLLESKILQLSVDIRQELREKVADYFSTAPKEDIARQD